MKAESVTSAGETCRKLLCLIERCDSFSWASAWVTKNQVFNAAIDARKKMDAFVIGTHQYITDPECLIECMEISSSKVVAPGKGPMFHPKLYAFRLGDLTTIYVGSSNLTNGGLARNIEAGVFLTGDKDDPELVAFYGFIQAQWRSAEVIDEDFVASYIANQRRVGNALDELGKFIRLKKPAKIAKSANYKDPSFMSWSEFVELVRADKTHGMESRLSILDRARMLFASGNSFKNFTEIQQKCVMGLLKPQMLDGLDWGYFGQMSSHGLFSTALKEDPVGISRALDRIPLMGPVRRSDFDGFLSLFRSVLGASDGWVGLGTRLLAMKRPDYFVCICKPNKRQLADAFSTKYSTINLENYWERIIEPMHLMPWWQQDMPADEVEQKVWAGRAAMLDAIYYDPSAR